jgi:hypothetical protein
VRAVTSGHESPIHYFLYTVSGLILNLKPDFKYSFN